MKLHPTTPQDVRDQRDADLKLVMVIISIALVDYKNYWMIICIFGIHCRKLQIFRNCRRICSKSNNS